MACVLVTGASGFIGPHLVEALLARGDRVRCLVRSAGKGRLLRERGAELVRGDLSQPDSLAAAVAEAEVVYHLAGVTKALSQREMFQINRDGTGNLARACAESARSPRLVVVSSVAAAGPAPRGQLRIEADPPAPISHYGQSKLAGEKAALQYADRVPTIIVRPGIVFGPRDRSLLKAFKTIRLMRFHPSPGLSPPPLSWIYVADLVELLLRVGQRIGQQVPAAPAKANGHPGQGIYFAAAPEYPSYAEMGKLVRPMLSRPRAPIVPIASPVAWCVAGTGELISQLRRRPDEVNFDKIREALVTSWACSGEAASRDLGFAPQIGLADRFQQTIDWYCQQGWL